MSILSRARAAVKAFVIGRSTPEDWFREFGGDFGSAAGLIISQYTAMNVSTIFACVGIRSKDFARCGPRLLPKSGARSQAPIENHPVARIFDQPNPLQTWFEFAVQMHAAFILKGNAYAAIQRDRRGDPIALWPLNPDWVHIYETAEGELFYSVTRNGLYLSHQLKGWSQMIPEEDIFHLRSMSFNSLSGLATISVARDAIGVALGLEQQAARFMSNGARPAGVLQTDKTLQPDTAKRIREQWESLRSGIQNAGKTAILEEGLKWEAMQLSSVDLEFIAQRKFSIEDIARFFGVPLHKLAVAGEVGKLRLDQADQSYVNTTIMPDLDMWEQKFDKKFELGRAGLRSDFDERNLLRAEEATRVNNQRLKIMSGISTQNEARAENGDPPVDGADVLLTPVNLAAVGSDMSGTAPDGAGRPNDGDLPDPGAANENNPEPSSKPNAKPKAGDPSLRRVAVYVRSEQDGLVHEALAGKREGEAPDPTIAKDEQHD
jgi:HK97 family phage portal protein